MKKRALDALKRNRGRMLSGAAVLAVGSVLAKVLGALYRVPLTNILGAEGMGMYQLVFPVFALFMVLSTAGIPTALSRMVAEKRAEGAPTKKYLLSAIIVLMALGTMFAILTFTLSGQLAKWQGNGDTRTGFMIIAPTLI
ncbi:MAG: oligosaccharide flippase family protein, partial [Bacteroides sp.]|nr:oligosaccharide flippase family protein [Bacteroides sp.]